MRDNNCDRCTKIKFRRSRRYLLVFSYESVSSAIQSVVAATDIPSRTRESPITSQHIDIAASLQAIFEQEVIKMAQFAYKNIDEENLLFCGGCAQNCVVAGHLRDESSFKQVFTSPVGSDMGNSLGAALLYERQKQQSKENQVTKKIETHGFYLGSPPGKLPTEALPYILPYEDSLHAVAAQMLSEGKIIGWVRGRMELGLRALGARSILADPRQPNMQSVLNQKIKFRESFRPFAPAILAEEATNWFDISFPSNFMQYTANLKLELRNPQPEKFKSLMDRLNFARCNIPSVVHVDYSALLSIGWQGTQVEHYFGGGFVPEISNNSNNAGMAVISLLLSLTLTCPKNNRCSLAQALTRCNADCSLLRS